MRAFKRTCKRLNSLKIFQKSKRICDKEKWMDLKIPHKKTFDPPNSKSFDDHPKYSQKEGFFSKLQQYMKIVSPLNNHLSSLRIHKKCPSIDLAQGESQAKSNPGYGDSFCQNRGWYPGALDWKCLTMDMKLDMEAYETSRLIFEETRTESWENRETGGQWVDRPPNQGNSTLRQFFHGRKNHKTNQGTRKCYRHQDYVKIIEGLTECTGDWENMVWPNELWSRTHCQHWWTEDQEKIVVRP